MLDILQTLNLKLLTQSGVIYIIVKQERYLL